MDEKNCYPSIFGEDNEQNEDISQNPDETFYGDRDPHSLESMQTHLEITEALQKKRIEQERDEMECRRLCREIFNAFSVEIGKEAVHIEQELAEKKMKKIQVDEKIERLAKQLQQLDDKVEAMNLFAVLFGIKKATLQERDGVSAHWVKTLRVQTDLANEIAQFTSAVVALRRNQQEWSYIADQLESPIHTELIKARWNVLETALRCQSAYKNFQKNCQKTIVRVRELLGINPEDFSL